MHKLLLHDSQKSSAANKLQVTASAKFVGRILEMNYHIDSPADAPKLVWPSSSESLQQRKDELWKTTCLEAFIELENKKYFEINLAPQGSWNVYSFNSYREGMKTDERVKGISSLTASMRFDGDKATYELHAQVDLSKALSDSQNLRLGLTAVIETQGGERSYWSLKHAGEKPDFHDSRGFLLELSTRP